MRVTMGHTFAAWYWISPLCIAIALMMLSLLGALLGRITFAITGSFTGDLSTSIDANGGQ
jgi:hypothetical protein